MNPYPPQLAEALVKAEQATGLAADDVLAALGASAGNEAVTVVLEDTLRRMTTCHAVLRRLTWGATLALILSATGCAATRSQLVATWEPEPDVYVSYRLDLGLASPMGERSH